MWRDDAYLLDILIAARRAIQFGEGTTWEGFRSDDLLQHAITRCLEIVGEAARSISDEMKEQHPEIPWRQMIGLRHRLIHEYFRVNLETVWDTVQHDLPDLIRLIQPLVPPDEADAD